MKRIVLLLTLALALIVVISCGGSSSEPPTAAPTVAPPTATEVPQPTPVQATQATTATTPTTATTSTTATAPATSSTTTTATVAVTGTTSTTATTVVTSATPATTTIPTTATTPSTATTAAAAPAAPVTIDRQAVARVFAVLPTEAKTDKYALSKEMNDLGRLLYYDKRLSLDQDIACNSCHLLDKYGVDNESTSTGHLGAKGGRNAPTVYNAALELAQFWDGRSPDVEDQAKGPIQNQIEMGMPTGGKEAAAMIKTVPGYEPLFKAAFPKDADPITFENLTTAIAAFERKLITPDRFDKYLAGDDTQLNEQEKRGLQTFMNINCTMCHNGPTVGGQMYMKLGLVKPYPTKDEGRFVVTQNAADKFVFKVSMLRNIAKTGPYFHDGSVATLDQAVKLMAEYQLGKTLTDNETADIVAFLNALTGDLPTDYIVEPAALPNGPNTPKPGEKAQP